MRKINKFRVSLLLAITVFTFSVMSVSAISVINPANSVTVNGGSAFLNANISTSANNLSYGGGLINCSFYAGSTLTANSSWTFLGNAFNASAAALNISMTFDSAGLQDANDYQFNATCFNTTAISTAVGTASVTVHNTVPQAPTITSPVDGSSDADGTFTFEVGVIGVNTTSCTLFFDGINPGNPSYSMTHSGNTCTYSVTSIPEQSYRWYVRASDESNTTDSSRPTVQVDISTSASKLPYILDAQQKQAQQQQEQMLQTSQKPIDQEEDNNLIPTLIIVVLVVVLIVVWIKKKK